MSTKEDKLLVPKGFNIRTVSCGINTPRGTRKDLLLIATEKPASAAGVFTTNRVKAAPVLLSQAHVSNGMAQAIIVNSGNANACNGEAGMSDAESMVNTVADGMGIASNLVLIASTGVIGRPMPIDCILEGIEESVTNIELANDSDAARAIMTTDTVPKEHGVSVNIGSSLIVIGGIAKGAGMICPNMATMISVLTTDAAIAPGALRSALRHATDSSYNCLSVDGDMSTNDTVLILANGHAGNPMISTEQSPGYPEFLAGLVEVCTDLAKKIARDGEGATKLIEIEVVGAASDGDARTIGMTVANSALVKTAIYGNDPNWGRIICAVGYAEAESNPNLIDLYLCGRPLTRDGQGLPLDEPDMREALSSETIEMKIDLKIGTGSATIWTCDMSHEYVTINAEYTT